VKMYLAFMGPYGEASNYPWDMGGIAGIRRFLERVYGLSEHLADNEDASTTRALHQTIKKVGEDIVALKFNTAISALMVFVNHAEKAGLGKESYETFLKLLAPFAPHLAEELWHGAGHSSSVHSEAFPEYNAALTVAASVTIGVQVNGKVRGDITLTPEASEAEALAAAKDVPAIAGRLSEREIATVIYKPGRILNIIVPE